MLISVSKPFSVLLAGVQVKIISEDTAAVACAYPARGANQSRAKKVATPLINVLEAGWQKKAVLG